MFPLRRPTFHPGIGRSDRRLFRFLGRVKGAIGVVSLALLVDVGAFVNRVKTSYPPAIIELI